MIDPEKLRKRLVELREWQKSRKMEKDTSFWMLLKELQRGGLKITASELGKLLHVGKACR
jgi:hypothetical protein